MNEKRKRIVKRAFKGLVAMLLASGVSAAASPEFRDFLGDSDLALIAFAAVGPLLLAAEKAWSERSS